MDEFSTWIRVIIKKFCSNILETNNSSVGKCLFFFFNFEIQDSEYYLKKPTKQTEKKNNTRTVSEITVLVNPNRKFLGLDKSPCPFLQYFGFFQNRS